MSIYHVVPGIVLSSSNCVLSPLALALAKVIWQVLQIPVGSMATLTSFHTFDQLLMACKKHSLELFIETIRDTRKCSQRLS